MGKKNVVAKTNCAGPGPPSTSFLPMQVNAILRALIPTVTKKATGG